MGKLVERLVFWVAVISMSIFAFEDHLPESLPSVAVLRLIGNLDSSALPKLEKRIQELLEQGQIHFIFNCSRLEFISSSGLGLLLDTLGKVERKEGGLCLTEISQPEVYDAMNLLGLTEVFSIYDFESHVLEQLKER